MRGATRRTAFGLVAGALGAGLSSTSFAAPKESVRLNAMDLYDSLEAARAALAGRVSSAQLDAFLGVLTHVATLEPREGVSPLGGTRLGGAPDLPAGLDWPIRRAWPEFDAMGVGGSSHAAHIREHLAQDEPFAFLAQIDLSELAAAAPETGLPTQGRLLFFADLAVCPWRRGTASVRVIWDASPIDQLRTAAAPPLLVALDEKDRRESAEIAKRYGLTDPAPAGTIFVSLARHAVLRGVWRAPDPPSLEGMAPAAERLARDDAFSDAWGEAIEIWRSAGATQAYGSPICEQKEPRLDAAARDLFGEAQPTGEAWRAAFPTIQAQAAKWKTLLQAPLNVLLGGRFGDGVVYVLMRDADIAARVFERAEIVYQQT